MSTPRNRKKRTRVCMVCGKSEVIRLDNRSEMCRSCATKKQNDEKQGNFKHGYYTTSEYKVWQAMIDRCRNPHNKEYSRYGGRGISVAERWLEFQNFINDMGYKPRRAQIHRIDNDSGYDKDNCTWISPEAHRKQHGKNS